MGSYSTPKRQTIAKRERACCVWWVGHVGWDSVALKHSDNPCLAIQGRQADIIRS